MQRVDVVRIGCAQVPNETELEPNLARVREQLASWGEHEVDLVVFPECTLSGFSARPGRCDEDALRPFVEEVSAWCVTHRAAVVLPTAILRDGQFWNGGFVCLASGEVERFWKVGLTDSERCFFATPEGPGARVLTIGALRVGLLVCREIVDSPDAYFAPGDVDAIVWPGYWGWDEVDVWGEAAPDSTAAKILEGVAVWAVPLLQSNFSYNEASELRASGPSGRSVFVQGDGALAHQAPAHASSGTLVTLRRGVERWRIEAAREVF